MKNGDHWSPFFFIVFIVNINIMKNSYLINEIRSVIQEFMEAGEADIQITPIEPDYRSTKKQEKKFHVNYQKDVNGELIEIEGTLNPFHTGRSVEYGFEPGYFQDPDVESYWDNNWETIEGEIMNKLHDANLF